MIICISMRAPGGECAVLGLHKADRKSVKRQGIVGFRLYVSPVIGFKEVVNLVLSEECLGIRPVWIECEAIIIANDSGHPGRKHVFKILRNIGWQEWWYLAYIRPLLPQFLQRGPCCVPIQTCLRIAKIIELCHVTVKQQTSTHAPDVRSREHGSLGECTFEGEVPHVLCGSMQI